MQGNVYTIVFSFVSPLFYHFEHSSDVVGIFVLYFSVKWTDCDHLCYFSWIFYSSWVMAFSSMILCIVWHVTYHDCGYSRFTKISAYTASYRRYVAVSLMPMWQYVLPYCSLNIVSTFVFLSKHFVCRQVIPALHAFERVGWSVKSSS